MTIPVQPHVSAPRPWDAAVQVHAALNSGQVLNPVPAPMSGLTPAQAEYAVGVFHHRHSAMTFARYTAADVIQTDTGPRFVFGTPQFLTGYALGSLAIRRRTRRKAQQAAAPQWRPSPLGHVVVTTHRLWCEIITPDGAVWKRFDHDQITQLDLTGQTLTLTFPLIPPLRLDGAWAPWCAAVIAHHRFGPNAPHVVPALAK